MQQTILTYDGTFNGFLTCIFSCFEQHIKHPIITPNQNFENELFGTPELVITEKKKAERVWKGLNQYLGSAGQNMIYRTFLSELHGIENIMLNVINYTFSAKKNILTDYSDNDVLTLSKTAQKVNREKHRMEAFVRFQLTKDGIYFANVSPDFNVLPLIKTHFTNRYADQKWIIYDLKRHYGLFYDLNSTETITINFDSNTPKKELFTAEEAAYETLWKTYFKSTNIEERVNMALHIKHVPKRYWKYLSEKHL
jgi:probable DNA metabolism protein